MQVVRYSPDFKVRWNQFVDRSKNGTFLFNRDYMEYHADRFEDHSVLVIDDKGNIQAVLAGSVHGQQLVSHGGLTYGGLVLTSDAKLSQVRNWFSLIANYLHVAGFRSVLYKAVPSIYHSMPAAEDLYCLHQMGARLVRRDASTVVHLPSQLRFSKGKKEGIKKGTLAGVEIFEDTNFSDFFQLGREVLQSRHGVKPVHAADEMSLLNSRFPKNIRLFNAALSGALVASVLVFVDRKTAHTQYMFNSDQGLQCGALDLLLAHLIQHEFANLEYFSFGISTEQQGTYLNEGLCLQKEMFGGRTICHDFYEWSLTQ